MLGAGRATKEDKIDPAVGLVMKVRCGQAVSKGDVLADLYVNKETLLEEHEKQSRRKATGVDGVTKDEYNVDVHGHIDRLLERMKRFQYRPQPVRRTYIPKANGKLRPLGIPAYEDKLVQGVMANVLSDIYEGVFLDQCQSLSANQALHF